MCVGVVDQTVSVSESFNETVDNESIPCKAKN